jgi:superoxide dismutase, Fe-Mn family
MDTPPSSIYGVGLGRGYRAPPELRHDDIVGLGEMLCPLFCVSVHEHAWMSAGYGVWGKEEWLKKFWSVLDWDKVSTTYAQFAPDRQT